MNITEPYLDDHEVALLKECLDSKWVTQGPFTARFERGVAEFQRLSHAYAVSSCTAALHIATSALELGPGDEVIVPAFTWITSANAVEYMAAKAVFVDVDADTFNLDIKAVEAAITDRTRAIMAVHLFGLAADMGPLLELAEKRDLAIIEDAACAIGTTYKGAPVGELGDVGCFSFHPRKVITTGEGGLVCSANAEIAVRLQALRNHGASGPPPEEAANPQPWTMSRFPYLGFNYRMSDIQGAVGCAQVAKLPGLLESRRACAARYDQLLAEVSDLILPSDPGKTGGHSYQSYVVRVGDGERKTRNALMLALQEADIQTRPGTHAVHRLEYYADKYQLAPEDFPTAVQSEETTITLPIFPGMKDADTARVVNQIKQFFG